MYSSKTQIFTVINSLIYLGQNFRKLWNIFLFNICTEIRHGEECQKYGWVNLKLLYGPCKRAGLHWLVRSVWPFILIDHSQISVDASWEATYNISFCFPSRVVSSVIFAYQSKSLVHFIWVSQMHCRILFP